MASRKGRESRYNEPGVTGRLTGLRMPTAVARDEDGVEDVDAFFASPGTSASKGNKAASVKRKVANPNTKDTRRAPRPDVNHELGQRGRKTGMQIHSAKRGADGVEDVTDFFASPNAKTSSPSHRQSMVNRSVEVARKNGKRRMTDYAEDDDDDEVDMSMDNDSGMTPSKYMNGNPNRSPGSRRASAVTPASSTRSQNHASSSPVRASPKRARREATPEDDGELEGIDEDEEAEEEEQAETPPSSRRDKGKGRAEPRSEDEQDFGEYGGGGGGDEDDDDDQQMQYEDDQQADETAMMDIDDDEQTGVNGVAGSSDSSSPPARVAPKAKRATPGSPTKVNLKTVKRKPHRDVSEGSDTSGLRRSTRPHEKPFAFWRMEQAIYKRRQSGLTMVEAIRKEEQPIRMPQHHKRGKGGSRAGSRARSTPAVKAEPKDEEDDYAEWDHGTDPEGLTWDFVENRERRRRIAYTARMVKPDTVAKGAYKFEKIFSDAEYMAGGIIEIPVGSKKPIKPARDNTYMLYVERGVVQVLVYRTYFPIARGGFFFVPRGNSYEIENIGQVPCRLVFSQAREVKVAVDPDAFSDDDGYQPGMEADASVFLPPVQEEEEEEEPPIGAAEAVNLQSEDE